MVFKYKKKVFQVYVGFVNLSDAMFEIFITII